MEENGAGSAHRGVNHNEKKIKKVKLLSGCLGEPLIWDRLEEKRASRIYYTIKIGGYRDEDRFNEIQDAMIDAMIHLEKSLRQYIAKFKL